MKNTLYLITLSLVTGWACQPEKKAEIIVPTSVPTLTKLWETDTLLTTCESVIYDEFRDVLYVANINGVPPTEKDNDGFISIISTTGEIIELSWVTEISAPKGMSIIDSSLFVTDINEIIEIDIPSAIVVDRYPIEGSIFLNDISKTNDGGLYISDTYDNKIFKLNSSREISLWLSDATLQGPNGLLLQNEKLIVASYKGGDFYRFETSTKDLTILADSIIGGDGIIEKNNDYLVSTWQGEIYFIDSMGNSALILDTQAENKNAADIWYIEEKNMLLVPTFFGNTVTAYRLD